MGQKKILVIDDEPDVICYLSTVLSDEGFEVISANSGLEGLRLACDEAPDLITLDVTMPGISGIEVLTRLRRDPRTANIPVVVVTGVASFQNITDQRELRPPDGFIPKPVDVGTLISTVEGLLTPRGASSVHRG